MQHRPRDRENEITARLRDIADQEGVRLLRELIDLHYEGLKETLVGNVDPTTAGKALMCRTLKKIFER